MCCCERGTYCTAVQFGKNLISLVTVVEVLLHDFFVSLISTNSCDFWVDEGGCVCVCVWVSFFFCSSSDRNNPCDQLWAVCKRKAFVFSCVGVVLDGV